MCSMVCILIYLHYCSIFFSMFYELFIYMTSVERVRIVNICVTRLGTMMRHSRIVQHILDSLRMTIVACCLMFVLCVFHS
jgi:hypothetical protein